MQAIITGASTGIGREMATIMAAKKYDLLLIARSEDKLQSLCKELQDNHNITAQYLAYDLSQVDSINHIFDWIGSNNYQPSVLINNAGYGVSGALETADLDEHLKMMHLNMDTVVAMTMKLVPVLKKQTSSYILNVGSTAAYQAVPLFSTYAASKSFVMNFTRALYHELKETNISVTLLTPGPTESQFMDRAGLDHMAEKAAKFNMDAKVVAQKGIDAMFAKKQEVIPGVSNSASSVLVRWLPRKMIEKVAYGLYKK